MDTCDCGKFMESSAVKCNECVTEEYYCPYCMLLFPTADEANVGICNDCINGEDDYDIVEDKQMTFWKKKLKGFTHTTITPSKVRAAPTIFCTHKGSPLVFDLGQGKIFAGGDKTEHTWDLKPIDVIISLNGPREEVFLLNDLAEQYLTKAQRTAFMYGDMPNISINWQDGGTPPFGKEYIQHMIDLVKSGTNVLIHCVGGHGRTGTLLTAIALQAKIIDCTKGGDPINIVRKLYCKKSVETKAQIDWLTEVYKFKTKVEPIYGSIGTQFKGSV